ncbi:MAG: glyoxylate/hydroxypyruvate reductase A [Parvularculaceae bacterium]
MTRAPIVVAYLDPSDPEPWRRALSRRLPALDFRVWPDLGDPGEVRYAMAFRPAEKAFDKLTGLRAILALGAGVEAILGREDVPVEIPVVKLADEELIREMTDFVLMNVLRHHRDAPAYARLQAAKIWRRLPYTPPSARRVGVLGLGNLGAASARALAMHRFDVAGWSRTKKTIPSVAAFAGLAELDAFLARTDILVGLLPITEDTRGLLDAARLAKLPVGASIINAGRGGVIVEADLIAALASGAISHASLDVFETEPLPADHPFWDMENVTITPHSASVTDPDSASAFIVAAIEADQAGRPLPNVAARGRGY